MFKERIIDMLDFTLKQGQFILDTTQKISSANDFLQSQQGMVIYNSTCMCLQTIGETLKQVDALTQQQLLKSHYPNVPWRNIIALRNIISHEYATTDPEEIFSIIHNNLQPLLNDITTVITDIQAGIFDEKFATLRR